MRIVIMSDETHNRMCMVTPIAEVKNLEERHLRESLEANFHTALDVKYAISNDVMWAVFIHPLKELSREQVVDALKQVYLSSITFGTEYTTTDLVFPGRED